MNNFRKSESKSQRLERLTKLATQANHLAQDDRAWAEYVRNMMDDPVQVALTAHLLDFKQEKSFRGNGVAYREYEFSGVALAPKRQI